MFHQRSSFQLTPPPGFVPDVYRKSLYFCFKKMEAYKKVFLFATVKLSDVEIVTDIRTRAYTLLILVRF